MARKITCTNNEGAVTVFSDSSFEPFILAHVEGIYSHENNVTVVDNAMIDGGTYQGTVSAVRNIVITVLDRPENEFNQANRDILYTLFARGKKGTLIYEEDGSARKIDYYPESIIASNTETRPITISLICPDPYFYDVDVSEASMGEWIESFEFEHEFVAGGEELGYRSQVASQDIVNGSATDNIGMEIALTAENGAVTNPYITRIESQETIKIGSSANPFTMFTGDVVTITTGTGNKHVYYTHNGVMSEINGYMTEDSVFVQLMQGHNNITYGADSNAENLSVLIKYRFMYEGA